jgi:5-methylcytosine-specific restriction endonuclease McrA
MAYDACVDCGEAKPGRQRRYARCSSCVAKSRTYSPEARAKIGAASLGRTKSPETRAKMSLAQGGDGDVENRRYPGVRRWTRLVKERDGRCTMCGTVENLEAHHIISKATRPELATVLENGLTLCAGCHRTEPWAIHKTSFNLLA